MCRSSNNGDNWTSLNLSLPNLHVYSLLVNGSNLFAATNGGVFLSTNNGINWAEMNNGLTYISANVLAASGINLFAGILGGGIFITSINGGNWTSLNNGLANWDIHALAVKESYTFIANNNGVYLSNTPGSSWVNRNQGFTTVPIINTLLIANNYIFAGTVNQSIWRRSLSEIITNTEIVSGNIPSSFSLSQNYPNPFNPETNIKFNIPKPEAGQSLRFVSLKVFDIYGREVQTLVNESLQPGSYEVTFNGQNYSSGTYFYCLKASGITLTKRMLMVK